MKRKNDILNSITRFRRIKPFILLIFCFSLVYQSVGQLAVLAYYQANKERISNTLCENRSKPMLHCEGSCYLSEQLKKLEEKEESEKTVKLEKLETQFQHQTSELSLKSFQVEPEKKTFFYLNTYQFNHLSPFFHPPTQSV